MSQGNLEMLRSEKFMEHIYQENEIHKEHRNKHLLHKLFFVSALLGFGSVGIRIEELKYLLFLVPFIAICHDVYIFAEDFKVKRIGRFIRKLEEKCKEKDIGKAINAPEFIDMNKLKEEALENISMLEVYWEFWLEDHREKYSIWASFTITILSFLGALIMLAIDLDKQSWYFQLFYYFWIAISTILIGLIFSYFNYLRKRLTT